MASSVAQPLEIELERTKELRIRWDDGRVSVFPLAFLRRMCPCAACRTEREEKPRNALPVVRGPEQQSDMATAAAAGLVGNYALRIEWQDGHNTGIYDYDLLRSLGQTASLARGQPSSAANAPGDHNV